MRRALWIFCAIALNACSSGIGSHSAVPNAPAAFQTRTAANTGTNWDVQTGGAADNFALQDLDFYPNKITIDTGDTITFHVAGGAHGDGHTVSFVPPGHPIPSPENPKDLVAAGGTTIDGTKFVNSGVLGGGATFTLLFVRRGTFRIMCLFHEPAMEFSVVVNKRGTAYPHDQTYYNEIADAQSSQDFADAESSISQFPFKQGGTTMAAGIDPGLVQYPPSDSTVLRFFNSRDASTIGTAGDLTVEAGTVVTFVNLTSNEPHTVTLPKAGGKTLPNIPPDPPVNTEPGVTVYDGSKIVNSGTFLGGSRFRLMFTKPGTYLYGCLYHANTGMFGHITVNP